MRVRDPIFILGTGRCGSSLVYRMLCHHSDVTWLSHLCNRFPRHPGVNRFVMGLLDIPGGEPMVRRFVYPSEAYAFWDHYAPGFSRPSQDLRDYDVIPGVRDAVRAAMEKVLGRGRPRLLVKLTGWPRAGFVKEIFPDARFIVVYRDGRAVATSGFLSPWFDGWKGPAKWAWGPLTGDQRARWEKHGRSALVLAGLAWEILMNAQKEANRSLPPSDIHFLRYEELCRDPIPTLRAAVNHAALGWNERFERRVAGFNLYDANEKWRRVLTRRQQEMLSTSIEGALREHGYE